MRFGDQLKQYRNRAGLTQRQLAEKAGLDFTYVSKIENGKVPPPTRDTVEALAKQLKLSDAEHLEFVALAGTIPIDMERWVVAQPRARYLYRSLRERLRDLPLDEQERLLEQIIAEVERERRPGDDDE